MEDLEKVSIVVPCYNAGKTIERCIRSIADQHYRPIEIVIIDDGSKDNSVEVIEQIAPDVLARGVPIKLYKKSNGGPSSARNYGIAKSEGRFIAFLDADDYWLPDKLLRQVEQLEKYPEAVLIGGPVGTPRSATKRVSRVHFRQLLYTNYFATSSVLVKSEIIKLFKFDETMKYSEDYRVWLQLAYQYSCYFYNEVLVFNIKSINERPFGLSSKLWQMEKGELSNYFYLFNRGIISWATLFFTSVYSFTKYIIRVLKRILH